MKIKIEDLKKAIKEAEAHSKHERVNVKIDSHLYISFQDRYDVEVEIKLSEDGNMLPKIRKEDILR